MRAAFPALVIVDLYKMLTRLLSVALVVWPALSFNVIHAPDRLQAQRPALRRAKIAMAATTGRSSRTTGKLHQLTAELTGGGAELPKAPLSGAVLRAVAAAVCG